MPDSRYHPTRWTKTSRTTRSLTRHRCCLCRHRATEVHHARYGASLTPLIPIGLLIVLGLARFVDPYWLCAVGFLPLLWEAYLPISGHEIPLWQVFPLCDRCHHSIAHAWKNYRVDRRNPWRNRNTTVFIWRLRLAALWRSLL